MPKNLSQFLFHFLRKRAGALSFIGVMELGWALDNTLWPYLLGRVIDKVVNYGTDKSQMWHDFMPLILAMLGLWLLIEVMFRLGGFMQAKHYACVEADVRMGMFAYTLEHAYSFFSSRLSGTVSNRIADMPQSVSRLMRTFQTMFIPSLVALAIALGIFASIHPVFAAILIFWVILHLAICFFTAKKCSRISDQHADCRSRLTGRITDVFSNIISVKAFARQAFELKRINITQDKERALNQRTWYIIEIVRIFLGVAAFIFPGVITIGLMFVYWQRGFLSAGDFVIVFNTTTNIMIMAWLCGMELPNVFREIGICQQAMQLVRQDHDIKDAPDAKVLNVSQGEIRYDNVSFQYEQSSIVFDSLSLTIKGGEKVGLVGFSGSGKTTFVNCLMRYFDINGGRILIDGQNTQDVTRQSLREAISAIPQEPSLFHRTIAENIRYGNPDASDEQMIAAAKKAHCHDFIASLPDGYQTLVGERGVKLSGGQRQRISIARAFLKDAPILVMDEATSALDSVTEQCIQDSLDSIMQQRTTIIIAHRLSTLARMDRIVVFEKGQIIEQGSHEALLAQQGQYAKLWSMQAGGFLPLNETA